MVPIYKKTSKICFGVKCQGAIQRYEISVQVYWKNNMQYGLCEQKARLATLLLIKLPPLTLKKNNCLGCIVCHEYVMGENCLDMKGAPQWENYKETIMDALIKIKMSQEKKEEDLSTIVINEVEEMGENHHVKEHDSVEEEPKSIALGTHDGSETRTGGPAVGTQTSETQVEPMVGNQHPGIGIQNQNETTPPSFESMSGENVGSVEVHSHEDGTPPITLDAVDVTAPLTATLPVVISEAAAPSKAPSENAFDTPAAFEALNANGVPSPIAHSTCTSTPRVMDQESEESTVQAVQDAEAVVQAIEERGGGMLSANEDTVAEQALVNELQNAANEHSYQSVAASMAQAVPELQVAVPPLPGVSPLVEVIPSENDVLLGYFAQPHQGHGESIFNMTLYSSEQF